MIRALNTLLLFATLAAQLWICSAVWAMEPSTLMRPHRYDTTLAITGWWMSEKLDGVRGYWDGEQLWSKNSHRLHPPQEFIEDLPPFAVEGELWAGCGRFEDTVSIVMQDQPHSGWLTLQLAIFDVPQEQGTFQQRIGKAQNWFQHHPSPYAHVIPQIPIQSVGHMEAELERIVQSGGEGLIVRDPLASYESGRSHSILKVKRYQDAEAVVVEHVPGAGRNLGRLGALLVERQDGVQFKIGSGFSDAEREHPPAVGSVITYKFYGMYQSGLPKFPVYLRQRLDAGL
ncbi:DNA ligase [Desulfuromonas acetoxidans]|uniref:DNA ligase n=1 Tax=Desulfuromonas acetoxidans TaxID=891 RepID=UPI00292FBEB9|nr:DNA ligase [Desulfuromonas acetoxidans]